MDQIKNAAKNDAADLICENMPCVVCVRRDISRNWNNGGKNVEQKMHKKGYSMYGEMCYNSIVKIYIQIQLAQWRCFMKRNAS